jgi:hypothetical protein
MGRCARLAWIIRIFAAALATAAPGFALSSVTAGSVALGASAGCSNGRIDITLATADGASREFWRATNLAGTTLTQGEGPTGFGAGNLSGYFPQVFSPGQPDGTLIGTYAYVGSTPPPGAGTAEFFVFYSCTTREVILACSGPYGTCPQTAQEAAAALAPRIPALGPLTLPLLATLVAAAGALALRRRP